LDWTTHYAGFEERDKDVRAAHRLADFVVLERKHRQQ
jgi:hypothetical protein